MKYRRKPTVVEAIQYTGHNLTEVATFLDDEVTVNRHGQIVLDCTEFVMPYDWIIVHPGGYCTRISPQGFSETYEAVE